MRGRRALSEDADTKKAREEFEKELKKLEEEQQKKKDKK